MFRRPPSSTRPAPPVPYTTLFRSGIALAKAAGRSGGRKGDRATHARIVALREAGKSIAKTAELADCDRSTVKRVWAAHRAAQVQEPSPQRNHRERKR